MSSPSDDTADDFPLVKLHIGGRLRTPGWTSFDIAPGQEVDMVRDCRDLSRFEDDSIDEIYASHVLEHLSYRNEIVPATQRVAPGAASGRGGKNQRSGL